MKHSLVLYTEKENTLRIYCSSTIEPTNSEGVITGTLSKIRMLDMWGTPIPSTQRAAVHVRALPKLLVRMLALTDPKFTRKILFTLQMKNEAELKELISLFVSSDFLLTPGTKNTIYIVGTFPEGELHLPTDARIKILKWVEKNPEQAANILYNLGYSKGEDIKDALTSIEKITD